MRIIFYTKEVCSLCDEAEALLSAFSFEYPHTVEKRDIYSNDAWLEEYQLLIPVVEINGEQLNCEELNYNALESLLKKHRAS
ncbi:glutaredoxin family protein [Oceanobacillus sp. FSL H7-0719]|uniref:glutaredoxin family protein n=1 Tax=Oceanobacillus sp. FSL H7-0719 TaxID=2954507 RepID=UPI003251654C